MIVASKLFELGVKARHYSYDKRWRKVYKSSLPTISVGNIACGGSGKTPFTMMLAKALGAKKKIAILSRGYRSKAEKSLAIMSKGEGPLLTAEEGGDEPFMMARNLPGVMIFVGRDRIKSAKLAEKMGAEMLILDDGMQHRRLARDEEVVILDGTNPFGPLLPRGKFRDIPERLQFATLIVVNRFKDEKQLVQIQQWSKAPIVGCRLKVLSDVESRPLAAFCALGNPESFFLEVEKLGGELRLKKTLPDHRRISCSQLELFAKKAKAVGAKEILCTEKDWVKLEKHEGFSLPIRYLKCEMEILYGNYDAWLGKLGDL